MALFSLPLRLLCSLRDKPVCRGSKYRSVTFWDLIVDSINLQVREVTENGSPHRARMWGRMVRQGVGETGCSVPFQGNEVNT